MPHTLDYREENRRQARLEEWYRLDGRHDPAHPMHCLFTGLADKYRDVEVGEQQ